MCVNVNPLAFGQHIAMLFTMGLDCFVQQARQAGQLFFHEYVMGVLNMVCQFS